MPEIEFFGEIEEIQKNPDGVIRLKIKIRKAYSDAINRDRWIDIQLLYPGVETGFTIKQKEVKNDKKNLADFGIIPSLHEFIKQKIPTYPVCPFCNYQLSLESKYDQENFHFKFYVSCKNCNRYFRGDKK